MDRKEVAAFWQYAWMSDHQRPLTPLEEEFVGLGRRSRSRIGAYPEREGWRP